MSARRIRTIVAVSAAVILIASGAAVEIQLCHNDTHAANTTCNNLDPNAISATRAYLSYLYAQEGKPQPDILSDGSTDAYSYCV